MITGSLLAGGLPLDGGSVMALEGGNSMVGTHLDGLDFNLASAGGVRLGVSVPGGGAGSAVFSGGPGGASGGGGGPPSAGAQQATLPVLALPDNVLLPYGVMRFEASGAASISLIEHLLTDAKTNSGNAKDLMVGVVPFLSQPTNGDASTSPADEPSPFENNSGEHESGNHEKTNGGGLFPVGTAARVMQLVRTENPRSFALLLQGVCRFRIDSVDTSAAYLRAKVTQIDLTPEDFEGGASNWGVPAALKSGGGDMDDVPPDVDPPVTRLRAAARALVSRLQRRLGRAAVRHVAAALASAPPPQLAWLLAGASEATLLERLELLASENEEDTAELILRLITRQVGGEAGASGSGVIRGTLAQRSKNVNRLPGVLNIPGIARPSPFASSSSKAPPGRGANDEWSPEDGEDPEDLDILERRLKAAQPPPDVLKVASRELKRLKSMGENQPGASATRAYIECLAELPWRASSEDLRARGVVEHGARSLAESRKILDEHHYGLDKIKERLVQYLAVRQLTQLTSVGNASAVVASPSPSEAEAKANSKGVGVRRAPAGTENPSDGGMGGNAPTVTNVQPPPRARAPPSSASTQLSAAQTVLCFAGAPGVGKTSLGQSIAKALGRPFARVSLGGVRDEADIRGHRRTYVGAMAGRIIEAMRRARCNDPVILLDELDKTGKDIRGDPAAALLEVLDPEQNHAFVDHYLNVPFDLSKVVFLATANDVSMIPPPLLDRMELIRLAGYTLDEKVSIASRHLLPRSIRMHGVPPSHFIMPPESCAYLAEHYTREAGVRTLGRHLAALCRHAAVSVMAEVDRQNLLTSSASSATAADSDAPAVAVSPSAASKPVEFGPPPPPPVPADRKEPSDDALTHALLHLEPIQVDEKFIQTVLGKPRFETSDSLLSETQRSAIPGAAAGLAWTSVGGDVLMVECCIVGVGKSADFSGPYGGFGKPVLPKGDVVNVQLSGAYSASASSPNGGNGGKGGGFASGGGGGVPALMLTGQLGDVIRESCQIAYSWIFSHLDMLLPTPLHNASSDEERSIRSFLSNDGRRLHIHLPSGSVPKDGPSAGVTVTSAIASLLTGRPCRTDTAMTGEITLRGVVLPVGGIKEKVLAAHRYGIRRLILPKRNYEVDFMEEVPAEVQEDLTVVAVTRVDEVLEAALEGGIPTPENARM